jgi:Kdo2-lipid IVA lauroyltransferase/acyltransferase
MSARSRRMKRAGNAAAGRIAVAMLRLMRLIPLGALSAIGAGTMRAVGPWLKEHRTGRDNLAAAFPEKSPQEIETILRGVWDNLGRVAAEFAHIDRLWDYDETRQRPGRIMESDESRAALDRLRDDGKPALIFAAHLANWELPAIAATVYGLPSTVLYRTPNLPALSDAIADMRAGAMGTLVPTGLDAPGKLADALKAGSHVAMLVDQYYVRGVEVTFFGRRTRANPLIARLAQHFDCPIHGVYAVRHPGGRLRLQLTDAVAPVRDADGAVDIAATMQAITAVVEGWIRAHPEQWLWVHRRWRDE